MKAKHELRALRSLYDLIPKADIPCVPGCSDCCGPVPASKQELKKAPKLEGYANQIEGFEDSATLSWCGTCPYVIPGGGCAVYNDRPFMCRLFGVVKDQPGLRCPHGLRTTRPISREYAARLTDRYVKIRDSDPETAARGDRAGEAWIRVFMAEKRKHERPGCR